MYVQNTKEYIQRHKQYIFPSWIIAASQKHGK